MASKPSICELKKCVIEPKDIINKTKDSLLKEKHEAIIDYVNKTGLSRVSVIVSSSKEKQVLTEKMRSSMVSDNQSILVKTYERCQSNHIRNIRPGMLLKSYAGHGNYLHEKIKCVDRTNQLLTIPSVFNKNKRVSFDKIAGKEIVHEKTITIANGDLVKLTKSERMSRQLGIKENITYQATLSENKKP